jgi:hypothetical protein
MCISESRSFLVERIPRLKQDINKCLIVCRMESHESRTGRILLVSTDFLHGGGGHLCLLRHMRRLVDAGFSTGLLNEQLPPARINDQFCSQQDFETRYTIPIRRWYWPPQIYRFPFTLAIRRWLAVFEGMVAILLFKPDLLLLHFNGYRLAPWTRWGRWLRIPVGVIVYDLRELWPESPADLFGMQEDSLQVLEHADLVWFVTAELQEEYRRRVPALALHRCRILPPIPSGHDFLKSCWRPEFATCTTVAFTGALKSACYDVFQALMAGMRCSSGRLILAVQQRRLAALEQDLAGWQDVVSLRPLHPVPERGLEWVAQNSNCLLVHYSFEANAEPLAATSFPSKFQEYSHMGLPVLIMAPPETPIGRWAARTAWPLYLDTLDADRILDVLEHLKRRDFWELCAQRSREVAAGEFSPEFVHRHFEAEVRGLLHLPAADECGDARALTPTRTDG